MVIGEGALRAIPRGFIPRASESSSSYFSSLYLIQGGHYFHIVSHLSLSRLL